MQLTIVSGLSGSGKTTVLRALEDLGYYCIDNLPVTMLTLFAHEVIHTQNRSFEHVAIGIDARNMSDLSNFPELLDQLEILGFDCQVLFLSAEKNTLKKRFTETRRKHPLSSGDDTLEDAMEHEIKLLAPLALVATHRIDTSSNMTIYQLNELIRNVVGRADSDGITLLFNSFGFKHGTPIDADYVFDVRCLPNPHWEPDLRPYTGLEKPVAAFLGENEMVSEMYDDIRSFIESWVARFESSKRAYLNICIGCTGGRHRSVFLTHKLSEYFSEKYDNVIERHRELDKAN